MSKASSLTKQILINTLIPLLKILLFIKKVITTFFLLLVFRPLKWLASIFFYRPMIKLYGLYLLNLKRFREIGLRHNPKIFLLKRFSVPIVISLIFLAVTINSLIAAPNFGELSNKMHKSVAASLVKNEFDTGAPEELITEEMNLEALCTSTPTNYQSNHDVIKSQPKITTNTIPTDNEQEQFCLVRNGDSLIRTDILTTGSGAVIAPERRSIVEYTVKAGDTISTIARQFGVSVNTILWANNLSATSTIRQGDKLSIPPVTGVIHKVAKGETIKAISIKYGVSADTIIATNGLSDSGLLSVGQSLIIPGGQKTTSRTSSTNTSYRAVDIVKDLVKPESAKPQGNKMQWPTVGYRITQYYSWRHTGLDIANKTGTPLYAADAGVVEFSGWSNGYGNNIVINHGGGKKTRYAHASKLYVKKGDEVSKGEAIAAMGSTGRSTGPHIHFEVIVNGQRLNPLNYIK